MEQKQELNINDIINALNMAEEIATTILLFSALLRDFLKDKFNYIPEE